MLLFSGGSCRWRILLDSCRRINQSRKCSAAFSPIVYQNAREHLKHNCSQLSVRMSTLTLYTPSGDGEKVPFLSRPDVDIKFIMDNIDLMKKNVKDRKMTFDFENLSKLWLEVQKLQVDVEALEEKKLKINLIAKEIAKKDVSAAEKQTIRQQSKQLRKELKKLNTLYSNLSDELFISALQLPNFTHIDTPSGAEGVVIEQYRDKPKDEVWRKSHVDVGKQKDILSVDHRLVHPGVCYLKKEAALLELALMSWMSENLQNHGLLPLSCPEMFKQLITEGCAFDNKQVYSVIGSDSVLRLTGVSLMSFVAYFTMMVLENNSLPVKSYTMGRNYNPVNENQEFKSLCDMHQSSMVHLFGLTKNSTEESEEMFEEYMTVLKSLFSQLQLHYRIVNVPSCQMSLPMTRKSSVQMWLPSEKRYVEVSWMSNSGDYVSRRLKLQYPNNPEEPAVSSRNRNYCHTVHGMAINIPAVIAVILETCQQEDGKIPIPEVLKPFMYGCEAA
ncbi:uncharacterized protein LOC144447144 [Glandiceps talaboti]